MEPTDNVLNKRYRINNQLSYPAAGLRTTTNVYSVMDEALKVGFRFFDTNADCNNEVTLGDAFRRLLPKYNLSRKDIYISSKLASVETGTPESVKAACLTSIKNLGVGYIDLYLMGSELSHQMSLTNAWSALLELQKQGHIISVGVANFSVLQLRELAQYIRTAPVVNQIKCHPSHCNDNLFSYCKTRNILIQGYNPFGRTIGSTKALFLNRIIKRLATKYHCTEQQILLMWALQHDIMVMPSTETPQNLRELIDFVPVLSMLDLHYITSISPAYVDSDITP